MQLQSNPLKSLCNGIEFIVSCIEAAVVLAYCTCAIVQTRVGETVVDRAITELASVATLTHTPETIHLVLHIIIEWKDLIGTL